MKRRHAGRRGNVSIFISLTILVFVGFVGLAIDTGYLSWVAQQLQIGADASALAGALRAKTDIAAARDAAINIGLINEAIRDPIQLARNDANDAAGDIVMGRFDRDTRTFTPQLTAINAVKVVARRTNASLGGPLPMLFGPVFNVDTVELEREAIAMAGGGTGGGILVLAPEGECALEVTGDTTTLVDGVEDATGAIQVNSTDPCAACFTGSVTLSSEELNVVGDGDGGGICITGGAAELPPEQEVGVDPLADPLAYLPDPWTEVGCLDATPLGTINMQGGEVLEIPPGYYEGGININNGSLTLQPGIYALDGIGISITGSGNIYAYGVMLYIQGTGCVTLSGGGEVVITPPDPDLYTYPCVETYEDVTIFQARDNTCPGQFIGTGLFDLQGAIYMSAAHVDASGDSLNLGNQFISYTLSIFGNGTLNIAYNGIFPAPGNKVYLVQ